jgi:hypothetical protein
MPPDEKDLFGEYAPEPQTAGPTHAPERPEATETGTAKYGTGKPHRIIVRGSVAKDDSTEDRRE